MCVVSITAEHYLESADLAGLESRTDVRQIIECSQPWDVVGFILQEFNRSQCQSKIDQTAASQIECVIDNLKHEIDYTHTYFCEMWMRIT